MAITLLDPGFKRKIEVGLQNQWKVRTELEEALLRDELDSAPWEKYWIKGKKAGYLEWEKLLSGQYEFVMGNDGNFEFTVDGGINWDNPRKSKDLMYALKVMGSSLNDVAITEKKCVVRRIYKSGKVETNIGQMAFVWSLFPMARVLVERTPLDYWQN